MYVPAPRTADRLARFLVDCLMEWNVDTKTLLLGTTLWSWRAASQLWISFVGVMMNQST
ncbi:hypothetical protein LINPERHAP2_LOCUS15359 [Linum perenne]